MGLTSIVGAKRRAASPLSAPMHLKLWKFLKSEPSPFTKIAADNTLFFFLLLSFEENKA